MRTADRETLRRILQDDHNRIDLIIVHHFDGSNDFFSDKPEVEQCERQRVIDICLDIASTLLKMGVRAKFSRKDKGKKHGCPGGGQHAGRGCPQ